MFCKNCAEVLTDTDVTCPKCGFAAGTGMKYCGTCGEELPAGAAVCEMCGTATGQPVYAQPQQQVYQQPQQQAYAQPQQQVYQQPYQQQPVAPAVQPIAYDPSQQKSKVAGGLLGIFLGAFGVHNFYLGYTGKAVAQLLITLLSCFTLSFVSEIWGLVEGIQILTGSIATDAKGIPLKD